MLESLVRALALFVDKYEATKDSKYLAIISEYELKIKNFK